MRAAIIGAGPTGLFLGTALARRDHQVTVVDRDPDPAADAEHMRPWVEDHVWMDESQRRRWAGEDVDLSRRLPSDLIMAASDVDEDIGAAIGPYLAMQAGPDSLDAVESRARAVYASGWRPSPSPGPTRDELVQVVRTAGLAKR